MPEEKIETRPGVDMSVPQLFVLRFKREATDYVIENALTVVHRNIRAFHTGHRVIGLGEDITLDVLGDVTLEELGLKRIKKQDEASEN